MSYIFLRNNDFHHKLRGKVVSWLIFFFGCILIFHSPPSPAADEAIRLSEWLSNRTTSADDYPLGLLWLVPGEEAEQAGLRTDLLKSIHASKATPEAAARLTEWISSLPVTGRVPVSIVDADWLVVNPKHNPVVKANHRVILPKRPRTVTLITSKGLRCQAPHVSGGLASAYLAVCDPNAIGQIDWAWLIQPDAKVKRFGIASWNFQKQEEPAPGAWIWMPYREDKWAGLISAKLATFLATQGVSADAIPNAEGSYSSDLVISPMPQAASHAGLLIPQVSANDWGEAGLLQTPSARMQPAGHVSMTYSKVDPFSRYNVLLQPFDWMDFVFRYANLSTEFLGAANSSGNQSGAGRSMDVKFALSEESAYFPQIAFGARDMTGSGIFSGEFVIANKRVGPFDWSLGLGWGYLGNQTYFTGAAAAFGGVQYQTPWAPLILKLEFDGNNYQNELFANNLPQNSRWNMGAVYRAGNSLDVTLGVERGNTLMLGFTLQTELPKLSTPKLDDLATIPVSESRPQNSAVNEATGIDLKKQADWSVRSIEQQGHELRVNVDNAQAVYWQDSMDRANAVLNRDAASDVDYFNYVHRQHNLDLVEHRVDRAAWVRQQTQPVPPSEQTDPVSKHSIASAQLENASYRTLFSQATDTFAAEPGVSLLASMEGPDGNFFYQIAAEEKAKWLLREDFWLQSRVDVRLLDNYSNYSYDVPNNHPRVRTYAGEYMSTARVTLPNLQMTRTGKLSENQYVSVYAGYLEMMFAGVGAEWMYRSLDSPIAFGIDVNRVQQRDFSVGFGLRDYQVDTGHATLYWNTGWNNVQANLSVGRYLAGDSGATVDLSRAFNNGVRLGGYFTDTNAAAQFGEGSFDKGIYVIIPFDAMLTKTSGENAHFTWHPVIRDGGAKLQREAPLYDMTNVLDPRTLQNRSAEPENYIPVPSQR